MKNIGIAENYDELRSRITSLHPKSHKKWGKMSLEQMLSHCSAQLEMALGEKSSSIQGSFLMRTSVGRWLLLYTLPWPKGSITPQEMNMLKQEAKPAEIEERKLYLLAYLEKVQQADQLHAHPFFGNLSKADWQRLIYKHIDHHLQQFSA
ncbi:MAG: DUF1569 domain-containing protein [Chitinophagales bacterium]|nr:DUF1569 domain-containing protein [Chitinophagales bacterium]